MAVKPTQKAAESQAERFQKAARDLGAEDNEAKFNEALGKVARHKPKEPPTHQRNESRTKK